MTDSSSTRRSMPSHVLENEVPSEGTNASLSDLHLPGVEVGNGMALANSSREELTKIAGPAKIEEREAQANKPESYIESYSIAWVCALQEEFQAARQMLDEKDFPPPQGMEFCLNDSNAYLFGKLGGHYVVVGCLPKGRTGLVNAAFVAKNMTRSFPNLKFALMVGIGGGAPMRKRDIRLGDVVVGTPSEDNGGVVQLDFGVRLQDGLFRRRGHLNAPPDALLAAIQDVQVRLDDIEGPDRIAEHIARMKHMPTYQRPTRDRLFRSNYPHQHAPAGQVGNDEHDEDEEDDGNWDVEDEEDCRYCSDDQLVRRPVRKNIREVTVHYGTIASDNVVMRDSRDRDKHAKDETLKIHCFEMEAAGLVNNFPCLVIRGISDYSDSHKNDGWHNYAALAAAAFAREVLLVLRRQMVAAMPAWATEVAQQFIKVRGELRDIKQNQEAQHRDVLFENQKASRFRLNQNLASLKTGITALKSSKDTFDTADHDHLAGTCEWLFSRPEFMTWVNKYSQKPVLWLNGKHGVGKTVLCAAAIGRLSPDDKSPSAGEAEMGKHSSPYPAAPVIVSQFFSKDEYITPREMLGTVAAQLIDGLIGIAYDTVPESIEPFLHINNDSSGKLQALIKAILRVLPLTYIFIDGLDEAEYAEVPKPKGSSNPTIRPPEDVGEFAKFLIQEAQTLPTQVRVWLSSQSLPNIRKYVFDSKWSSEVSEIQVTTDDTQSDIMKYLSHHIPHTQKSTSDLFAKLFFKVTLKTEVEGSFLWASTMVDGFNEEVLSGDDLFRLALKGLTVHMSDVYEKILGKIIKKERGSQKPPLWKVVLSMLTFAKRPLKMCELMESVLILTSGTGDLSASSYLDEQKIIGCCLSLVRHTRQISDDNRNVGYVRLSHSAVRTFLLDDSTPEDPELAKHKPFLDRSIIRDSCIRYLKQERYRTLLKKHNTNDFGFIDATNHFENVLSHQFLLYAAKYWFQHFDTEFESADAVPAERDKIEVEDFLKSANFRTCMQVQSLFITGHFLQSFDSITDSGRSIRRTLPNWMRLSDPELHRHYQTFQGEWCRLLQARPSDDFRGEIDRCFWGALGSATLFASQPRGRYFSFEFSQGKWSREQNDSCQVHHVSQDGRHLSTAWIQTRENQKQICVEQWTLDGRSQPRAKPVTTMPFSATDTCIERYTLPCAQSFHSFSLVPTVESVVPPRAVTLWQHGHIVRLGSKIFRKTPAERLGDEAIFLEITGKSFGASWEDVCVREPFLVVCRRRVYRERPQSADDERERQRVERLKHRMSRNAESRSRSRNVSPLPPYLDGSLLRKVNRRMKFPFPELALPATLNMFHSDEDSSGYLSNSETDSCDSQGLPGISSAEESWSEGISSAADSSDNEITSQGPEESDDSDTKDNLDMESQDSEDDVSDIKSSLSIRSDDSQASGRSGLSDSLSISQVLGNSSSSSDGSEIESDVSEDDVLRAEPAPANPEPGGEVAITSRRPKGRVTCDTCNRHCSRRYHCLKCSNDNFDLCEGCERRGLWCLDLGHQLYKVVNGKPVGVVSRRNFDVRQELAAYRTDSSGEMPVKFHFRKKYPVFLYDSPPVIHPKYPLVVWALSDSRLLFGDLAQNNCFEQKINTAGPKRARPICVSLSFSACGNFLRMAIIDAVAEKPRPTKETVAATTPTDTPKARLCLNLHVLVLQISSTQPARNPPKLLTTTSCRLGCSCARAFVPTLPFAFTWRPLDLYVTLSDSYLHVYRVVLPRTEMQKAEPRGEDQTQKVTAAEPAQANTTAPMFRIVVPKLTILLPRSSRNRSVQFFPAGEHATNATVIIGPRYGQNPAPPIGVYLSEKDLGGWVDLKERRDWDGIVCASQKTLEGQFEEPFDEDTDCILIPFDGY